MITHIEEILEFILDNIVELAMIFFELIGVGIVVWSGIISFWKYIHREGDAAIRLAKGMAIGLQFMMGGEILRTVIVREWQGIAIVGGIMLLRAVLSFILHWEMHQEEKAEEREERRKEERK